MIISLRNRLFLIETFLRKITSISPFTNVFGLCRALLASGTLLTLITNPVSNFLYILKSGLPASAILLEDNFVNKFNFFLLTGFKNVWIMKLLAIIILALVISGYLIKLTSVLHWWIVWSFMMASSAIDGGDQIATNLSFLLIPLCLLDNRTNHWNTSVTSNEYKNLTALFAIQIIRLQVAMIYFHAAIGKFSVTEWAEGTAVYYWFNNGVFGLPVYLHMILDSLLSNKYVILVMTYGTMITEISLFLCLTMSKRVRKYFFLPAIIFHFSIILIHGIFSFFFSMAACLVLYLLDYTKPLKKYEIQPF